MSTIAPAIECQKLEVDPDFGKSAHPSSGRFTSQIPSVDQTDNQADDKFRHEHGRRYHAFKNEAYALPNDADEAHRLDIQDLMWKLTLNGGLHLSPIPEDIKNAIDLGTGTGQWAIDFATAHPRCNVIGTDLSPIQPDDTPPNCSFIVHNANEDWNFSKSMDFIHSRMLIMGLRGWKRYFELAWTHLKPGGWMEVQEVSFPCRSVDDGNVTAESPVLSFSTTVQRAAETLGIDTNISDNFREMVEAQGFINVRYERVKWPIGLWAVGAKEKEIGELCSDNVRNYLLEGIGLKLFTSALSWSEQQVHDLVERAKKDLDDPSKHYYFVMTLCSAQKPSDAIA